jgi:hypothetical protein
VGLMFPNGRAPTQLGDIRSDILHSVPRRHPPSSSCRGSRFRKGSVRSPSLSERH